MENFENMLYALQEEVQYTQKELAQKLKTLAVRATEDALRVEQGGLPCYSEGAYAKDGGDIAALHSRLRALGAVLRQLKSSSVVEVANA